MLRSACDFVVAFGRDASRLVAGFIEPLVKELPMEYAVEMNKLIELQMEGTVG
jgi:Fe-S cluster assembly protein SufB